MAANLLSLDHVHGVVETLQLCSLTLKVLFHVLAHSSSLVSSLSTLVLSAE